MTEIEGVWRGKKTKSAPKVHFPELVDQRYPQFTSLINTSLLFNGLFFICSERYSIPLAKSTEYSIRNGTEIRKQLFFQEICECASLQLISSLDTLENWCN